MWVELFLTAMGVLTVTLSVLLATALLIGRPGAPRADRFLAGFLLLSAVDLAGWTAALMPAAVQSLLVFRLPVGFLQMPWLLAYVLTLSEPKTDCRPHLWAGGALAAVSLLSLTPRALSMAGVDFLSRQVSIDADLAGNEAALHLQFYVYAFLIGARVFSRTEPIPDQRMRRWLKTLLAVSLSAHTLVLAKRGRGGGGGAIIRRAESGRQRERSGGAGRPPAAGSPEGRRRGVHHDRSGASRLQPCRRGRDGSPS